MERTALKTTRAKNRSTRTTTEKKAKAAKAKAEPKEVFKVEIGPPKLTRFERARIIGARALQLSLGAPPFMPASPAERDPITLASKELDSKALPISIKRTLPDGRYQDIAVRFLL